MSETTRHGDNIAGEIQGEDCYGRKDTLTVADVWNIIDNLHSAFMGPGDNSKEMENRPILHILERWMNELEEIDDGLPL